MNQFTPVNVASSNAKVWMPPSPGVQRLIAMGLEHGLEHWTIELTDACKQWLEAHVGHQDFLSFAPKWRVPSYHCYQIRDARHIPNQPSVIYFSHQDDAMLFKLTWG